MLIEKPSGVHQREGRDQRDRDGHHRDDRGAERAQEQQSHQHDQAHGLGDGREHGGDRALDEHGRVVGDHRVHAGRQVLEQLRQGGADGAGDIERVGGGLLDDADRDRVLAVEAGDAPVVLRRRSRPSATSPSVTAKPSASLTTIAANCSGVVRPVRDSTRELAIDALDPPGRDLEVLAADRVLDVLDGQAVGRQPVAVEPDPHGVAPLAQDLHLGHAGQVLQPVARVAVDEVGDVERGDPVAGEGEIEDRVGVGLDLVDDRLVDLVGQPAAHARDPVAHVGGRVLGVGVEREAGGDPAGSRCRLVEDSTSMPGMPAIEASSTWVTWVSMISGLAPG